MEPVLECLHKRRKYKAYSHLEWISNSSLQLHRLAHEELGLVWSNCDKDIPITSTPEDMLANLDITDPKRPILRRPKEQDANDLLSYTQSSSNEDASSTVVVENDGDQTVVETTSTVPRLETEFEESANFSTTVLQSIADTTSATDDDSR
jgi:hypothetical protein